MNLFLLKFSHASSEIFIRLQVVSRVIVRKHLKYIRIRNHSCLFPVVKTINYMRQIIEHFQRCMHQFWRAEFIYGHGFQCLPGIDQCIQPYFHIIERELRKISIALILPQMRERGQYRRTSVADQNFDGSCSTNQCDVIGICKELCSMRTLSGHDEDGHSERSDRANGLHPCSPIAPVELVVYPQPDHYQHYEYQTSQQHVAAAHESFKSFHEGIIS